MNNQPQAVLLTGDQLHSDYAKTAHGLLRASDKYEIKGIVDHAHAGQDGGEVMDGIKRNIPVFGSIHQILEEFDQVQFAILGVAPVGGKLSPILQTDVFEAINSGLSIINGLHTFLSEDQRFIEAAKENEVQLIDIRKPKPRTELAFWSGDIFEVKCPIIAVLGTDCAIGKRTTTRLLVEELRKHNLKAEMINTGQTGMIQNDGFGFVLDSTVNDFVSGELENAVVNCYKLRQPDVILLEGQASLLNPSGPCGSEYLVSGNAKYVILQHAPLRDFYKGWEHLHLRVHPLNTTIQLIQLYGSKLIGLTLNYGEQSVKFEQRQIIQDEMNRQFAVPALDPLKDSIYPLIQVILKIIDHHEN